MKQKSRILNRVVAVASTLAMTLPMLNGLMTASAAETEQYPYTLFGRNGISVNTSHLCINGNLHANTTVEITSNSRNVNGKITTADTEIDRVKHVYADSKIYETYFAENGTVYEEAYTWDEMNIHVNSPVFSYGNMDVSGNISLNSCLGSFMDLTLTGEVSNANNAVLYSKYGDITVDTDNVANINGLIYAPLGTLTIDAPNVNLNGLIIADAIIINGSTVNINGNSNLARFIGNTSEAYDFSGLEYLPEAWLGDADEDGLFDLYEKVIDTDPQNEDTDGDALPDGHEVLILNTDPLLTDSDANGIADSDEDFDTDGLTNLEEYLYQTEPFTADTDNDGLTDGEEVHTTKTNPLDSDTDDDKLIDGDEGENGAIYLQYGILFEPLQPDTDGNGILDGDEVFEQTLEQEIVTEDEVITQVTVDMETNGNIAQNLTIESMQDVDALSSNVVGLIGEPLEFTSATEFDSATISFTIDQSQLGDTAFDNLLILWYNEEEGIFEEMPTDRDRVNSTVSTTTTHFSQYLVVDGVKWDNTWRNSVTKLGDMWSDKVTITKPYNNIFLIDCSTRMGTIDPLEYVEITGRNTCKRIAFCENVIDNMELQSGESLVITYSDKIEYEGGWHPLTTSAFMKRELQQTNNGGGTSNAKAAIDRALQLIAEDNDSGVHYRVILLTHSDETLSFADSYASATWENTELCIVNCGPNRTNAQAELFVVSTGGKAYDAVKASDLTIDTGKAITILPQFVGKDSDNDGIPDLVETYGLKPDGTPINSDPNSEDTDGDGLSDNEELGFVPLNAFLQSAEDYMQHISYRSDPNNQDTDGDGITDDKDSKALIAYTTLSLWQSQDEEYSTPLQSELLKLHLAWKLAETDIDKEDLEARAIGLRQDFDDRLLSLLDQAKIITGAAADEFSWIFGGDTSRAERDYWLYEVQKVDSSISISEEITFHAIMFIVGLVSPSPEDAWRLISKKASEEMLETVGEAGAKKFLRAMTKYASKQGANGIKKLSGTGIKGFMYEVKVMGKGGAYRLLGNMMDNGEIFWEVFERTHK